MAADAIEAIEAIDAVTGEVEGEPHRQAHASEQQGGQVGRQGVLAPERGPVPPGQRARPERLRELRGPRPAQPVARRPRGGVEVAACRRRVHLREQRMRHRQLAHVAAPCQALDGVQRGVLRVVTLGTERGRALHRAHQPAGALHERTPVGIAQQAQRRDRVAHAQVVRRLLGLLLRLRTGQVGHGLRQPAAHAPACRRHHV